MFAVMGEIIIVGGELNDFMFSCCCSFFLVLGHPGKKRDAALAMRGSSLVALGDVPAAFSDGSSWIKFETPVPVV